MWFGGRGQGEGRAEASATTLDGHPDCSHLTQPLIFPSKFSDDAS